VGPELEGDRSQKEGRGTENLIIDCMFIPSEEERGGLRLHVATEDDNGGFERAR